LKSGARQRRGLALAVQAAGFLVGLGLLAWAVSMALKNREQLSLLGEARWEDVAALLGLSLATLVINGVIFWLTLLPARRLKLGDVLATNGIACSLAYLPFKIGAIARVVIHNRRDRVPLVQIGAWFSGVAVLMVVAFAPPVLAALWLKRIDWAWVAATVGGEVVLGSLLVSASMYFRGARGVQRLARVARGIGLARIGGLLQEHSGAAEPAPRWHELWSHLHSGFDMLAHPGATAGNLALRLADVMVQGLRFAVAASILNLELPFAAGLVIALAYFTIGVVSPFIVGMREIGAVAFAALMLPGAVTITESGAESPFAAVALLVTAMEALVFLAAGTLGMLWLRPDRLVRVGGRGAKGERSGSVDSGRDPVARRPPSPEGSSAGEDR
jgi:hypothetical protein